MTVSNWHDRAACRDVDPELFFPPGEQGRAAREQIAEAKAVCRRCPVVAECLQEALDRGDRWGVRGGATAAERRALRLRAVVEA